MMNINVKYFGMVAEAVSKNSETVELDSDINLEKLKQFLFKTYPQLENIKFQIAVNQEIVDELTILNDNDEAAILPPFAGG